jgi:hypothetical protein
MNFRARLLTVLHGRPEDVVAAARKAIDDAERQNNRPP